MMPHNLPREQDVTTIETDTHQISVVRVTPENTNYLVQVALSMYLGEACKYCGKVYETLSDLKTTVWAGYHARGRLACKTCWDENNKP
jgi:hypothetical protein